MYGGKFTFQNRLGQLGSGKEIYHFCFLLLCIRGQIPSTSLPGGLYSEGRFNGGFFALEILGGLYLEGFIHGGLILGILRYLDAVTVIEKQANRVKFPLPHPTFGRLEINAMVVLCSRVLRQILQKQCDHSDACGSKNRIDKWQSIQSFLWTFVFSLTLCCIHMSFPSIIEG